MGGVSLVTLAWCVAVVTEGVAWWDASWMPMSSHTLLLASCIVLIGAHASLPQASQEVETLGHEEAMALPLVAFGGLAALFIAYRFVDAATLNALLRVYFVAVGTFACGEAVRPFLPRAWFRGAPIVDVVLPVVGELRGTVGDGVGVAIGAVVAGTYGVTGHWLANNAVAAGLCVSGLAQLLTNRYATAAAILAGLFVYDIVMVYGTPMMLDVATKVDGPIKLVLPRGGLDARGAPAAGLLGLGDIIVPGLLLSLVLRFDTFRALRAGALPPPPAASPADARAALPDTPFPRPLFLAGWLAYMVGLLITLVVMFWWEAGQPALFFLVPCVLLATAGGAAVRGELRALLTYTDDGYVTELDTVCGVIHDGSAPPPPPPAADGTAAPHPKVE